MITKIATLITVLTLPPTFALADQDTNREEKIATTVNCRVLDATGTEIAPTSLTSTYKDNTTITNGEGDLFSFIVELSKPAATLSLNDKRSGHKVTVKNGMFNIDEVVSFRLITDESPNAPISLECVGK